MINRDTLLGAALGAGGFYLWQRWEAKKRAAMTFAPPMHRPIGGGRHPGGHTIDGPPGNFPFTESGAASAAAAAGMNIEEWEAAGAVLPAEFQVAGQAVSNRTHRMGMRPARSNPNGATAAAKARRMRGKLIRARLRR